MLISRNKGTEFEKPEPRLSVALVVFDNQLMLDIQGAATSEAEADSRVYIFTEDETKRIVRALVRSGLVLEKPNDRG